MYVLCDSKRDNQIALPYEGRHDMLQRLSREQNLVLDFSVCKGGCSDSIVTTRNNLGLPWILMQGQSGL